MVCQDYDFGFQACLDGLHMDLQYVLFWDCDSYVSKVLEP